MAAEQIPPPQSSAHFASMQAFQAEYDRSVTQPAEYFAEKARELLTWERDFDTTMAGGFEEGDVRWFTGGKLNVSYNCLDRHLETRGDQVAIIWEADEPGQGRKITYRELHRDVCRCANAMKAQGVRKGDTVALYMPMVPEAAVVMLACYRVGAVHSIVFAGFSVQALRDRIVDARSQWVFTTDQGVRGGRVLNLKATVDSAVEGLDFVRNVFVFPRTHDESVNFQAPRDVWMHDAMRAQRPYCPPETMDSEDPMFILYTSGSTGTPKGLVHTSAGYLLWVTLTTKYTFDLRDGDVFACMADVGWITGASYVVVGPLSNGTTTVMFESTPMYPTPARYWQMVEEHRVTQFYTAPTAIRALARYGEEPLAGTDRSSLRVLGTVGEPINPSAHAWYREQVGENRCHVVDTYWQTETGGHVGTPLAGVTPMKAGSCSFANIGIKFTVVDAEGAEVPIVPGQAVEGRLCISQPWPGMARTVFGNHPRYLSVYTHVFHGHYFTGDGCRVDEAGFFYITGRVDDVLNTSGHRIGTAEVEAAACTHAAVAECAVVGFPHEVKGEGICLYAVTVPGVIWDDEVKAGIRSAVRSGIGAFATPDHIINVPGMPKTRSGKLMRRILRKIIAGEEDQLGDVSTLADPAVVPQIIDGVKASTGRA